MLNVRFGAGSSSTASLSSFDSKDPSPVPSSGDPIEPGGRDEGRQAPKGPTSFEYSLLADSFEQPRQKKEVLRVPAAVGQ
jgi:hypothetical protein